MSAYLHGQGVDEPMGLVTDHDGDGNWSVFSLVRDHLNSVRLITDESRSMVQRVGYSAYGETFITNLGARNKLENMFYYTSRELDQETGDYYYRARYYDPGTGRFLSEDPIGFVSGDNNFYRYVMNRPVNLSDSNGNGPVATELCKRMVTMQTADRLNDLSGNHNETLAEIDQQIQNIVSSCVSQEIKDSEIKSLNELRQSLMRQYYLAYGLAIVAGNANLVLCGALIAAPGP